MDVFADQFRPWHQTYADDLLAAYASNSLHHAWMLAGAKDLGKAQFAQQLAKFLLCEQAGSGVKLACGQCKSCLLVHANTHPDLICLSPPDGKQIIPVDAVRLAKEQLFKTAQMSANKVCLIAPADALNESSANALLKLLEEPPEKTYFILPTNKPHEMLPTIKSRCMKLAFGLPASSDIRLALQNLYANDEIDEAIKRQRGFPEKILDALASQLDHSQYDEYVTQFFTGQQTALQVAKQVGKAHLASFLESLYKTVYSSLYSQSAAANGGVEPQASNVLSKLSKSTLLELLSRITASRRPLALNPNVQLFIEALLLDCKHICRKSS